MLQRGQSMTNPGPEGGSGRQINLGTQPVGNQSVFQFDPASIVRGIVFHVLDEGIASEVTGDSVKRTIERLKTRKIHPSIDRTRWSSMTNRQRMDWLLAESKTATSLALGRTAVLIPAT